jgi:ammonia channel protein AmtB
MLKNLLDACGASIAFYCLGYAFAFGDGSDPNRFIGTTNFFLMNVDDLAFWLFQYAFRYVSLFCFVVLLLCHYLLICITAHVTYVFLPIEFQI